MISKIGVTVAVLAFVVFLVHDILVNPIWQTNHYLDMLEVVLRYFMFSVTIIVMAVPEGLPMAVTLSLALNMRRMLKSNNLVRKLHASETMGAVTVICTDKTGTLTQNKMQVNDFARSCEDDELLFEAISANTTAELSLSPNDEDNATTTIPEGIGNPTEVALLLWCYKNGKNYNSYRSETKILHQLPFSTERKYMATISLYNGVPYLFIKGAPEVVLSFCNIAEDKKAETESTLRGYQDKAMRTLALAYKQLDSDVVESIKDNSLSAELLQSLTLQAVFAISDPIRNDVPNAVSECQRAGINVKMVTGDTSATAIEIAKQIGIWDEEGVSEGEKQRWHITGTQFADLDDNEAYERVASLKVMSRARPTDKQRLVELLQARNEVVAVTGDGTNDAPALNHAHVGLSLGSGTSVAKEASAMTLLDDSFSSITLAVMWGRSLYRNIQRFLYFQLIVNLTALLLVVGGAFIGTNMPLTVTQILWVNLIMDTFAAMALASLPPSKDVLKEMPRKQSDFIISNKMFRGILTHGIFFFIVLFSMLYYYGNEVSNGITTHHLTIFFTTFVMIQLWNLFNAKTFGCKDSAFSNLKQSKGLLLVFLIVLIGQWLIVSFGGKMFRTEPLSLCEWGVIIALTSLVLWVEELKRLWTRRTK